VLANQLRLVNEHVLFSSAADAEDFLEFYRSQSWAETESEPCEFATVRVALPESAA
jgi:uncharacterized protein YfcZ (UPF0381/DUF406 family)